MDGGIMTTTKTFNLMKLSPGAIKLLMTLIAYNGFNSECFPSEATLLSSLGIKNKYSLHNYLEELVKNKLVSYKLLFTTAEGSNGKKYQKPYKSYVVASYKMLLTTIDGTNTLNLDLSSGKLLSATLQDVTGNNTYMYEKTENSLLSLTQEQKYKIARDLRVDLLDVTRTESAVLDPDNIIKYKHTDTYRTTRKWLQRKIAKGEQKTLGEEGMMILKTLHGGLYENK